MENELIEEKLKEFQLQQGFKAEQSLLSQTIEQVEASRKRIVELENLRDNLTHLIVHDLKNPLTGIISINEILIAGLVGPLTEDQKKQLKISQAGAKRLTNLIMDILETRKIEENQFKIIKTAFGAEELINSIRWIGDVAKYEEKTVDFKIEAGTKITADKNLVTRVLENLLNNAVKHTPRGGKISLNIKAEKRALLFEVIDSGEGIPPEYLGRIFEKFFKVSEQKLKTNIDTGLGLTFCKLAVEAHGGTIGVESQPDKGSRFYFYLPGSEAE